MLLQYNLVYWTHSLSLSLIVAFRVTLELLDVPIEKDMKLLVIYEGGYPDPTVTWTRYINEVSNVLNDSRASVSGQFTIL